MKITSAAQRFFSFVVDDLLHALLLCNNKSANQKLKEKKKSKDEIATHHFEKSKKKFKLKVGWT